MNDHDPYQSDDVLSRAQRLKADAKVNQESAAPANAGIRRVNVRAPERTDAARAGVRTRAMNKRIRDIVREQEETFYTAPAPSHTSSTRSNASEDSKPLKPKASSWEDIANEVAATPTRGLATGAMRGDSVGSASVGSSAPIWLPSPKAPRAIVCPPFTPDASLHQVLGGEEKICDINGAHYLVSKKASHYDAHFSTLRERLIRVLEQENLPTLSGARVEDLLFVDIETTGLSSSQPLFLIGALHIAQEPVLDLFFARDLDEENAVLAAFARLAHGKTLVTFNGKSFDWPYIEGRSRAHRVEAAHPRAHLDLLHHARRNWKHSLPNCKLQTLELFLCGRTRIDDISGGDIPRTYYEFASRHAHDGGGAHLMSPILHHNSLDILTTAELLCILGEKLSLNK